MEFAQSTLVMGQITQQIAFAPGFTPAIDNYLAGDVASAAAGPQLTPTQRVWNRMASDLASNSVAYASVPTLAVPINRVGPIAFNYSLIYFTSDVAEGIGVRLAFSGAANQIAYTIDAYTDATTHAPLDVAHAFGTAIAPFATGPGPLSVAIINIRGACNVTTIGDLNVQFRAETGGANSATMALGSWGEVWATS